MQYGWLSSTWTYAEGKTNDRRAYLSRHRQDGSGDAAQLNFPGSSSAVSLVVAKALLGIVIFTISRRLIP